MNAPADKSTTAYRTPAVRDLAWACFSQPMLRSDRLRSGSTVLGNCAQQLTPQRRDWLEALDARPEALLQHLGQPAPPRLGLYFERLWHFYLEADEDVELLAHNLPVQEEGRTVGEFDCIYYCRKRMRHVHLELAVKFYLQRPGSEGSDWRHWLGPNREDRLDRKLQRLLQHQLQLGAMPAARPVLELLGIEDLHRELEVKGRLFRSLENGCVYPDACLQPLQPTWHATLDALPTYLAKDRGYRMLEREQWLAPISLECDTPSLRPNQLLELLASEQLARPDRPRLVVGTDDSGVERERFFVVPASW